MRMFGPTGNPRHPICLKSWASFSIAKACAFTSGTLLVKVEVERGDRAAGAPKIESAQGAVLLTLFLLAVCVMPLGRPDLSRSLGAAS